MAMPNNLFLIRHGESEGNVAIHNARSGDESAYTDEFVTTPDRNWQLTTKGISQAQITGKWLKNTLKTLEEDFSNIRFYVSPFVRTRQTAGHLGLDAEWFLNRSLRERDWGDISTIPYREFLNASHYKFSAQKKKVDPLYWRPPGGESIVDVAENRVRNFLDTLHRKNSHNTVIAVTHGEFMRATRLVLERVDDETYLSWDEDPNERIENCEIFQYSRIRSEEGTNTDTRDI